MLRTEGKREVNVHKSQRKYASRLHRILLRDAMVPHRELWNTSRILPNIPSVFPPKLQSNRPTGLLLGSINWQGDLIVSTHQIPNSSQSCTSPPALNLSCSQMQRMEQPKCEIKVTLAGHKHRYPLGLTGLQGAWTLEGI